MQAIAHPPISVIIPAIDEEEALCRAVRSARQACGVEVIVVDGGSRDSTRSLAVRCGARLVEARQGRGAQMNAGASIAQGDVLLFLHADTRLPCGYAEEVKRIMHNPSNQAGAFRLAFDRRSPALLLIQSAANLRSRWLQMPYGDQAIFLRRETFRLMGGYRELPVMEDYDLICRLRKAGKIKLAELPVITSARRYIQNGPWRTVLRHQRLILAWHLGRRKHPGELSSRPVDDLPTRRAGSRRQQGLQWRQRQRGFRRSDA